MSNPQKRTPPSKWTLTILLPVLAVLLGSIWWGWHSTVDPEIRSRASLVSDDRPKPVDLEPAHPDAGGGEPTDLAETPASPPQAREAQPAPVLPAPRTQPVQRATLTLAAHFVDPAFHDLTLEGGTLVLIAASGKRREESIAHRSSIRIEGLDPDHYVVDVIAPGFDHYEQELDLPSPSLASSHTGPGETPEFEERFVLWPPSWIAVVCQTQSGKPFVELAAALGLEPKRVFVDAFEVRTRLDPPIQDVWESDAPQPAEFRKPPTYPSWELPGSAIGSLRLIQPPPIWVGLRVYRRLVGWELLSPGERAVVFRLDESAFEERFAALTLTVVDPSTGAAVTNARVTLRADVSAHRRKEHEDVESKKDGLVSFARIVPGRYELSITRDNSSRQDFVELAASERRDLGKVPIGVGQPFEVRVVDEQGHPVTAWIEIGAYRSGARTKDLYPPMISHSTDPNGLERLPTPVVPSIVRATLVDPADRNPTNVRSANALIDPRNVLAFPTALVVRTPARVRFEVGDPHVILVEIKDALGLIVAELRAGQQFGKGDASGQRTVSWEEELVPGNYRFVCRGADGDLIGEREYEVGASTERLVLP